MSAIERDNLSWIRELRSEGEVQQAALRDLRKFILRGLRRSLASRPMTDDSFFEDTAQESLLRIVEKLNHFEGRSRFLTWATSVAIRVATTELRRRRWKDVSLDGLVADGASLGQHAVSRDVEPDAYWERNSILEEVNTIIGRDLSEKQRMALLAELRGMPQVEIARHLGCSKNALYKVVHDARKNLRRCLISAGYEPASLIEAFSKRGHYDELV